MLPVLDISDYLSDPNSDLAQKFVSDLRETCHGPGFFYLIGHGVDQSLDHEIIRAANQFFELPIDERESLAIGNSPHFRGYTLLKNERTGGKIDWRDQIDIGPEEPEFELKPNDPPWLRLRGPNQWPQSLPSMPTTIQTWMAAIQPLGMALMQALAKGLGKPGNYFDDRMEPDAYTRVKVIRYPAQPEQGGSGQGLGLHHDSGILSFILQDEIPGLQVMNSGELIDVESRPGAYVVNLAKCCKPPPTAISAPRNIRS